MTKYGGSRNGKHPYRNPLFWVDTDNQFWRNPRTRKPRQEYTKAGIAYLDRFVRHQRALADLQGKLDLIHTNDNHL